MDSVYGFPAVLASAFPAVLASAFLNVLASGYCFPAGLAPICSFSTVLASA